MGFNSGFKGLMVVGTVVGQNEIYCKNCRMLCSCCK